MSRIWLILAAVLLAAGTASAAEPGGDTTNAVMSECSAADIPAASVDSCLERVRILEETESSPGLASLEARLEARVASDHEPMGPAPSRSGVEVRPYSAGQDAGNDAGPADEANAAQAATGAPRSLDAEGPPAYAADAATLGGGSGGRAAPDNAAAANPPPDVAPDDEPPIADPPDADEAPPMGSEGTPPGNGR